MKKTNAARFLDALNIAYELLEYPVDEDDLSAEDAANKLKVPTGQIFKTLVARGDRTGVLTAIIPGRLELDLKTLAKLSGNKKVGMVPLTEVLSLTGYVRGAVSPLGMKKNYPYYLDQSAFNFADILISAGARGVQIRLAPQDLVVTLGAVVGNISC